MNWKDIPMPFDFTAYLADTTDLSTVEHGAYFLILGAMWRSPDGHIECDESSLARLTRLPLDKWKRAAVRIKPHFQVREADGWISNKKLLAVRAGIQAGAPAQDSSILEKPAKPRQTRSTSTIEPSLLPSLDSFVENTEKDKKVRKEGAKPLPADWVPAEIERLYGRSKCQLTDEEIEIEAEKMRRWAFNVSHLAKGRKPRWDLCFRNFLDDAGKRKRAQLAQRQQNGSGSRGRVSFGDMIRDTVDDMNHGHPR